MVRAANIKTTTGYTNRPIAKLYPLEVTSTTTKLTKPKPHVHNTQKEEQPPTPLITDQTKERPVRAQARLARERIRQWTTPHSAPPEDVEN